MDGIFLDISFPSSLSGVKKNHQDHLYKKKLYSCKELTKLLLDKFTTIIYREKVKFSKTKI